MGDVQKGQRSVRQRAISSSHRHLPPPRAHPAGLLLPYFASSTFTAKERPIGFYHTGPTLRSSDLEICELFKRFVPKPVSRPRSNSSPARSRARHAHVPCCYCFQVMGIVDVRPTGGRGDTGIPTDAYFAVEEIKDVSQSATIHAHVVTER